MRVGNEEERSEAQGILVVRSWQIEDNPAEVNEEESQKRLRSCSSGEESF